MELESNPSPSSFRFADVRRVFILRPDNLGDVVLFSGTLRHIRALYPSAEISLCIKDGHRNLLDHCPYCDQIVRWNWLQSPVADALLRGRIWDDLWHLPAGGRVVTLARNLCRLADPAIRRLQCEKHTFDLVLAPVRSPTPEIHRAAGMLLAPEKIGVSGDLSNESAEEDAAAESIYTKRYPVSPHRRWEQELRITADYMRFLGCDDLSGTDAIWPEFWCDEEDGQWAARNIHAPAGNAVLAICPGASSSQKYYPARGYASAINQIAGMKWTVVLLGSQGEVKLCMELQQALAECGSVTLIINLSGKTTIRQMVECLRRANLVVSVDSGPLHIATALRKPTVGIMSALNTAGFTHGATSGSTERHGSARTAADATGDVATTERIAFRIFPRRCSPLRSKQCGIALGSLVPFLRESVNFFTYKMKEGLVSATMCLNDIERVMVILNELPQPPNRKTGWPWTEKGPQLTENMPDGKPWPKITIVTPSFNQGRFIEEAIRSVLSQGYPNLEYFVIDGGSTDDSHSIIERYRPWLSGTIIERDRGQVDAIQKGLRRATGDWFNWLNSDDVLLPNALKTLATIAALSPNFMWISGTRLIIDAESAAVNHEGNWRTSPSVIGLGVPDFPQDATFVRTKWLKASNGLEEEIRNVFDTLLYYRLSRSALPLLTTACFSAIRLHGAQKTADKLTSNRESKTWIEPEVKKLPLFARFAWRLLAVRGVSRLTGTCLCILAKKGLTPSARRYMAATYDYTDYQWKLVPASELVQF